MDSADWACGYSVGGITMEGSWKGSANVLEGAPQSQLHTYN